VFVQPNTLSSFGSSCECRLVISIVILVHFISNLQNDVLSHNPGDDDGDGDNYCNCYYYYDNNNTNEEAEAEGELPFYFTWHEIKARAYKGMAHANDAANAPHPMAHHCDKLLHRIHELVWQMVQTGGVVIAIQSQYGYMMASAASSSSFWTAKQKQQQPPSTMSLGLQASSSCSLSSNSLTSSPSSCTGDEDEEDDNNEVIGGTCCVMGTPGANFLSTGSCTMARITTQSMLDQHDKMLVFSLFQYLLACTIAMTPRQYSHCVWCHHQSFHHGYGPFSAQVAL